MQLANTLKKDAQARRQGKDYGVGVAVVEDAGSETEQECSVTVVQAQTSTAQRNGKRKRDARTERPEGNYLQV